MREEEIRTHATRVVTEEQREFYCERGYLLLEGFVSQEWIGRLRAATDEMVERLRLWQ